MSKRHRTDLQAKLKRVEGAASRAAMRKHSLFTLRRLNRLARITRCEIRQRRGSQYARDHAGEPGRNGGPKGQ